MSSYMTYEHTVTRLGTSAYHVVYKPEVERTTSIMGTLLSRDETSHYGYKTTMFTTMFEPELTTRLIQSGPTILEAPRTKSDISLTPVLPFSIVDYDLDYEISETWKRSSIAGSLRESQLIPIVITVDDIKRHVIRDEELKKRLIDSMRRIKEIKELREGVLYELAEGIYIGVENGELVIYVVEE